MFHLCLLASVILPHMHSEAGDWHATATYFSESPLVHYKFFGVIDLGEWT